RKVQPMRRAFTAVVLAVCVTAPLRAQADAAEALARSVAEIVRRDVIEPAEPPVEGDGAMAASLQPQPHPGPNTAHPVVSPLDLPAPDPSPPRPAVRAQARRPGEAHWPVSPPRLRQACLQVFLF